MYPYNVDKVFEKHKKQIANAMKSSLQPHAKTEITDEMIKQQVAKGWVATKNSLKRDRVLCLNCGNALRTNATDLQASKNHNCTRCQREFTF